jgi:hypothetical protein
LVAEVTDKISPCGAALAALLVACFASCAFGETALSTTPGEVTLHLEPLKASVKEDEAIEMLVVFVGGAHETTLILPMGADPTGILTYRAIEVASGREWAAADLDPRSFAADARQRLPAGGKHQRRRRLLQFDAPKNYIAIYQPARNLPAGTYRIIAIYDEARTFRPENRGSRMIRSEPVEIVVTAR